MNPENEIFETCDSNQTEIEQHTKAFERCNSNQTKTGRGGARPNSGMKASGIETVTVRIDKRLLNTVTEIKGKFKTTESLDDLLTKNNDTELKRQNFALNNVNKHLCKELENEKKKRVDEVKQLNDRINTLNLLMDLLRESSNAVLAERASGLDSKLRKRIIQFCHPDKFQDVTTKQKAGELVQALNGLAK